MAITVTISQRELKRVAALAYEGETLKVMLCSVGTSGFTASNTVAEWQTVEQLGNGYLRYSDVIEVGSYNTTTARYEIPAVDAAFTATGAGYIFDRVICYIEGETYIHSMIVESPNIALAAGQTQTYRINLSCDD